MKKISKRERVFAITTVAVAVAALVFNFVAEPLVRRWRTLDKKIREKEILLAKHTRILRNKNLITRQHERYGEYFQSQRATPEEESADVLSAIERIARSAGVRITNIKPLAIKKFENYSKYTFRVTSECDIKALTKFMYDLQASKQLLKIERMVIRPKEKQADVVKAVTHITKISVY